MRDLLHVVLLNSVHESLLCESFVLQLKVAKAAEH